MTIHPDNSIQPSQDEMIFLQGQLNGLESIFLELVPFRVPLKRQDIQDFYMRRLDWAMKPEKPVQEDELRRQFNAKANQVRNIVDCAESLGKAGDKLNLLYAASSLPADRTEPLNPQVKEFCQTLVNEATIDERLLNVITSCDNLRASEARLLLTSMMFLISEDVKAENGSIPLHRLLRQLIDLIESKDYLNSKDPFLKEAQCLTETMQGLNQ
jgi:hypothetical protein